MSKRDEFRQIQTVLGTEPTGIPNDSTKAAFQTLWDSALDEYRESQKTDKTDDHDQTLLLLVAGSDFPIVGHPYLTSGISAYLDAVNFNKSFKPDLIVIHHCAEPSLVQRPNGFITQHMLNLRSHYKGLGWNSGPHFFVDDKNIWPFTPLYSRGVHAKSFNAKGVGIEMLGDYDNEEPWKGRGAKVLANTRALVKSLFGKLKLDASSIRFHRDDPKTQKSCPGKKIVKKQFLDFLGS